MIPVKAEIKDRRRRYTMTTKTANTEDLRAQVREARAREQELAREADQLPAKLQEASRRVVAEFEKARQARDAANYGFTGAERQEDEARRLRKAAEEEIAELEDEYPGT